jgi:CHAD domain-containing protein
LTRRRRLPTTHVFLARQLRVLLARLEATFPRVLGREDEEAIHDMRVALRRLRVVLKLARPVYGRFHVDAVRTTMTRVHRASGALRDEEVLRETLTALGIEDWGWAELLQRRRAREETLRRVVEQRLRAGGLRKPIRLLRALLALPVPPKRRAPLSVFARRAAARAMRDVDKLRDAPTDAGAAVHQLRIAYKRLRYTAEVLEAGLPLDVAALAKPAAQFQKVLGTVHDLDVATSTVRRARSLDDRVKAAALRRLAEERALAIEAYRALMKA